ncbi:hypothetical protein LTR44_002111 [Exophiala sp. CCFEE 6388]|nr:hypothetical protein LTR44_002111 [Eurotiomycetes sp. CCFEE 6388]
MPYNNAPIEPPEEITGSSVLPLARVKKIIAMDEDIAQCSTTAAFAISIATEEFVRYLAEQAHNVVKSERKPRRNIAYKDIDTVPKTKTYRQFREEKAQEAAAKASSSSAVTTNGMNGDSGTASIEAMMKNQQQNGVNGVNGSSNGGHGSPIAHRSAHQRTGSHPDPIRDIEMTD